MPVNEWFTPVEYIEAARRVLGSLDLDPASCEEANRRVRAVRYYTEAEDGLKQEWSGNVWCNPPYTQLYPGHSAIKPWTTKAIQCYEEGRVVAVVMLVPSDTSTRWFEPLWRYLICFPSRRIKFDVPGKKKRENPTFGTCFVYLGPDRERFTDIFSRFGVVVCRVSQPVRLTLWEGETYDEAI